MNLEDGQTIHWSTQKFHRKERYDAWKEQLNSVYCNLEVDRPFSSDYMAQTRHRTLEGLKIIECVCDPCGGARRSKIIGQDLRDILGLQLVVEGREIVRFGKEEIYLEKGDILLWDNTQPMSFHVQERLHKLSFILPLSRFRNWLPSSWYAVDRKIPRGSRSGNLLALYMRSLGGQFLGGDASNGDALTEATIGLIVNALGREGPQGAETLREAQLLRVQNYIEQNLDDPDLSPGRIAKATRISVRYLHWLFTPLETTVTRYIIQQRLQRCHRELSNPIMKNRTITDIAFSWGFNNPTHFSRRFKQEFGLSPNDFRRSSVPLITADA
jgi:AraC-like DNA-binding protein